jgi:hypothetical protein
MHDAVSVSTEACRAMRSARRPSVSSPDVGAALSCRSFVRASLVAMLGERDERVASWDRLVVGRQ